jgi:hypothetical protein
VRGDAFVAIGFGGRQVVVESDDPRLLAAVRAVFGAMGASGHDRCAPRLAVRRAYEGYALTGGQDSPARAESIGEALRMVRYEVVLSFMAARPDLLWLHAGAVARGGGALLIVGPGGAGKSTLATALLRKGFRYLGDDVAPIDLGTGRVVPFPMAPTVRCHPGRWLPQDDVMTLPRADVRLTSRAVGRVPVAVAALAFPRYAAESPSAIGRFAPGEAALALLQQSLNFPRHRETAVRWACEVAESRPAFTLTYSGAMRLSGLAARLVARELEVVGVTSCAEPRAMRDRRRRPGALHRQAVE